MSKVSENILITGGCGFIGSNFAKKFLRKIIIYLLLITYQLVIKKI